MKVYLLSYISSRTVTSAIRCEWKFEQRRPGETLEDSLPARGRRFDRTQTSPAEWRKSKRPTGRPGPRPRPKIRKVERPFLLARLLGGGPTRKHFLQTVLYLLQDWIVQLNQKRCFTLWLTLKQAKERFPLKTDA